MRKIINTFFKPLIFLRRDGRVLLQCRFFQHDFVPRDPKTRPPRYKYPQVYAPYGQRPPPSDKVTDLAKRVAALPSEERAQIASTLLGRIRHPRTEWVEAGCVNQSAGGGGGRGGTEEKVEVEKVVFDVKLEKFDTAAKIKVIKEVRAMTGLGLKEAKELVEKAPVLIKRGVAKEEADLTVEKIRAAGGTAAAE